MVSGGLVLELILGRAGNALERDVTELHRPPDEELTLRYHSCKWHKATSRSNFITMLTETSLYLKEIEAPGEARHGLEYENLIWQSCKTLSPRLE